MYKFAIAFLMICFFSATQSHAATQSSCPEKVLDTGQIEGIYQGTECGDFCHSIIKLDNGEDFVMMCGEEMAEKFFGKSGQRVAAAFEIQQFWNEFGSECLRTEVCTTGRKINTTADSIDASPSLVGIYRINTEDASGEIRISKSKDKKMKYTLDASVTNLPSISGLCEAHMLCDNDENELFCFELDDIGKNAFFIEIDIEHNSKSITVTNFSKELCGVGASFINTYKRQE